MEQDFSQRILAWFQHHGRQGLPWQNPASPYRVWVSEIMLQQTQVNTVIPYFERFCSQFPEVTHLACAPLDTVLHLWSGLGYYARARHVHQAAQIMYHKHNACVPRDFTELHALPGIGRSTAGAILALAYGQRYAILDGNVKRVLCRYHALDVWPGAAEKQLWHWAETYTPTQDIGAYTQAIMDLGATVCTRTAPRCAVCPLQHDCRAYRTAHTHIYPVPRPHKTVPLKRCVMLVLYHPLGHIFLQQRPQQGIWGGLWSLPEIVDDKMRPQHLAQWCVQHGLNSSCQWEESPPIRHRFTHFQLHIQPLHLKLNDTQSRALENHVRMDLLWYDPKCPPTCGLAAPVARLLQQSAPNLKGESA
jgi:A/G-specific adenine glycosylase